MSLAFHSGSHLTNTKQKSHRVLEILTYQARILSGKRGQMRKETFPRTVAVRLKPQEGVRWELEGDAISVLP